MVYQHKRSTVAGKVPVPADFASGEIIVNTADGKLYMLVNGVVKAFTSDDKVKAADSAKLEGKTAAQWQAEIDAKITINTTTNQDEVNLPIGTTVLVHATEGLRNSLISIGLSGTSRIVKGGSPALSGQWRVICEYAPAPAAEWACLARRIS